MKAQETIEIEIERLRELELCEVMMEECLRIDVDMQKLKNENEELKQQLEDSKSWWKW